MRLARLAALFAGILFAQSAPPQAAQPQVRAVRFWSLGEVTRVAIETDGEARYHAERIDSPDRLFIDLTGVRRPPGTRGVQVIPVNDRLLKQIRVAVSQPGTTRVVLDLAAPAEYSISQLTTPDRIIVELRLPGPGPAAPPVRSVTGSQSLAGPETSEAPKSVPVVPAASVTPAASAPAPAPFIPPAVTAAKREAAAVPEPPRIPPKREKLDSATPFSSAQAARPDSSGSRSLIRTLGLKLDRVVLDPGHGGHDTGTIGPTGLQEKDLVLDVTRRLGGLISKRLGSQVIYTREDDTFIPLEDRTKIATDRQADLFLSIHANSSRSPKISGSETFYLNFTSSADALEVAARENATSQTSVHDLQNLVQKITLNEKVQESREFASIIQKSLYNGIPRNRLTRNRGVKKAPFVVLIGAQMPSVLAEIAFLSNPRDEALLKKPEYRQRIAEALYKGVSEYVNALSHFRVARQPQSGSPGQ